MAVESREEDSFSSFLAYHRLFPDHHDEKAAESLYGSRILPALNSQLCTSLLLSPAARERVFVISVKEDSSTEST